MKDVNVQIIKEKLQGKYVSFLGDSITTWKGISDSLAVNNTFREKEDCPPCYPRGDVDVVEKTWWYKVIDGFGLKLLVNNAIGGSTAWGLPHIQWAACNHRCVNLHANTGELEGTDPDVIFVCIGVNDVSWTRVTVDGFLWAYNTMIDKMCARYPNAEIFLMNIPHPVGGWHPIEKHNAINKIIEETGERCNLKVIHLRNSVADDGEHLTSDTLHPNAAGMDAYYRVICEELYDYYCKK